MVFEELRTRFFSGEHWTLGAVTIVSFVFTGALLLGWDLIEHNYLDHIGEVYKHRMHISSGASAPAA